MPRAKFLLRKDMIAKPKPIAVEYKHALDNCKINSCRTMSDEINSDILIFEK